MTADLETLLAETRYHTEVAAPATPATNTAAVWLDTADGLLKYIDDAGVVRVVAQPGAWIEAAYTEITTDATITSTTEATPTTIVTSTGVAFDGSTPALIEFLTPGIQYTPVSPGEVLHITLFEGSTQIGRIAQVTGPVAAVLSAWPCHASYRFTPSSASHTYKIAAHKGAAGATAKIKAGSGGVGTFLPAAIRVSKLTP